MSYAYKGKFEAHQMSSKENPSGHTKSVPLGYGHLENHFGILSILT